MRFTVVTLSLVAGTLIASPVLAQDKNPLAGPKVKDNSVPGQQRQFGGGVGREKGQARPLPPGAFMQAVASLESKDAPANVALSEDQRTKIAQFRSDFEAKMKAYRDEHADEIKKIRDTLPGPDQRRIDEFLRGGRGPEGRDGKGEKRGPEGERRRGDQPPLDAMPDDDMMRDDNKPSAEVEAGRAKVRELIEGAPKPADAQQQVMALLSEAQKAHVKAEIERVTKERADRREGAGKGGPDGERMGGKIMENLTPEEREALKNMKPEERREFLRKKAQKQGLGQGNGQGRGKGEKKPK